MKSSISVENLNHAIKIFSEALHERCEHFLFFGSLLGMVRDNGPIEGDDDVDFYVNKNDYQTVRTILLEMGINVSFDGFPNNTEFFIKVSGVVNNIPLCVDFYFYDGDCDDDFILERWNFNGEPHKEDLVLKIPKPLIFPLKAINHQGFQVIVPQYPAIICEYLYGVNWKTPQTKVTDYMPMVLGGRVMRFKKDKGNVSLIP